jgi:hypothetical protein
MEHTLKTVNPHFQHVWDGVKTFEFRKNDRNYEVGDSLKLKEYFPENDSFSDRVIYADITHILSHDDFADVPEGYVILSIEKGKQLPMKVSKHDNDPWVKLARSI